MMGINGSLDALINSEDYSIEDAIKETRKTPWRREPFSVQSWGCWFHKIAPYGGRITPGFAHWLVRLFAKGDDVILDPFCGVGTIPLEANLQGKNSIGIDLNPYAFVIANAKMERKPIEEQLNYLDNLQFDSSYVKLEDLPPFILEYYHPQTLKDIIAVRDCLIRDKKDFLLGCLIGISQGHRPGHLSKPCAWTIPYKPKEENLYREVIPRLKEKVKRTYRGNFNYSPCGKVYQADSRNMPIGDDSVDIIISSPPYFDTLNYTNENRLRLGVMGYDVKDRKKLDEILIQNKNTYLQEMEVVIREMHRVLKDEKLAILVLGDCHRGKTIINTAKEIQTIMERNGFDYITTINDEIPANKSVQRTLNVNEEKIRESRIDRILVMRNIKKPNDNNMNKSDTIYNMHSYWTKQPISTIREQIIKYTKPGDTIIDCFSGSGMTGLAASLSGRNALLYDLSPVCCHITNGYCTPINTKLLDEECKVLVSKIKKRLTPKYQTKCEKCGALCNTSFSILGEVDKFDDEKIHTGFDKLNEMRSKKKISSNRKGAKFDCFELLEIVYVCSCSKGKQRKKADEIDITKEFLLNETEWYPEVEFFGSESKRNLKKNITNVSEIYSKRNISSLSIIKAEINKIEDEKIKQFFMFIFTSILFNCSLMSVYRNYENTSIKMGTLYIPSVIKDNNVLDSFIRKCKTMIKEKKQLNKNYKGNVSINLMDAKCINLKENSIDYAYIDPPYSDIINYSQLNVIWESWLNDLTDNKEEIIVNNSENKNLDFYQYGLTMAFKNVYKALKNNSKMTIIFNHPKVESWIALQNAIYDAGFTSLDIRRPERIVSTSKTASQLSTNKVVQDFLILTFKKDIKSSKQLFELSDNEYELIINKILIEADTNGYESKTDKFDYLMNRLINVYVIKPFNVSDFLS
jgi:DNA modification methylase